MHTHAHNIYYLLLFHGNNGYANAPPYYVIVHCLFCHITKSLPRSDSNITGEEAKAVQSV